MIAWWGTEALRAMPPYGAFPVKFQTSLDFIGLAFAVALGIVQRPALRRGAGASTRTHRSAAGAAERIEVRRPERRS